MEIKTGYASLSLSPTSENHFEKKKIDDGVFGEMFFDGVSKTKRHESEQKVLEETETEDEKDSSNEEEVYYYGGPLLLMNQESSVGFGETNENHMVDIQTEGAVVVNRDNLLSGEMIQESVLDDKNGDTEIEISDDLIYQSEGLVEEPFTSFVQEKEVFQFDDTSLKNEGDLVGETTENIINNEAGILEEGNFSEGIEKIKNSISSEESPELVKDLSASTTNESDDLSSIESSENHTSDLISNFNSSVDLTGVSVNSVGLSETIEVESNPVWLNQEEVFQELVEQSRLLREGDSTRLVLKLYPKMLGHMQVELSLENGVLQGRVIVENGEARTLLEQALQDHSFGSNQEVSVSVDIDSNLNQQSSFSNHDSQEKTGFYSIRKYGLSKNNQELSEQSVKSIADLSLNRIRLVL